MNYRKPKRIFEDSGTVDPKMSYHVELENVVNTKNQDIKVKLRFLKVSAQNLKKIQPMCPCFLVFRHIRTSTGKGFIS